MSEWQILNEVMQWAGVLFALWTLDKVLPSLKTLLELELKRQEKIVEQLEKK